MSNAQYTNKREHTAQLGGNESLIEQFIDLNVKS